jgi:3'5'-cyclic nucleotide phosphodiesterase/Adenylate and Guanylate cyclase catalytic domain
MSSVVQALETWLGPGTSELAMRIGIHSGPVMAGVLRGEKTRFQLFGDTMNTAARIESTGEKNRIHLSLQTASYLIESGKGDWVVERTSLVSAKGKGDLQTYWLTLKEGSSETTSDALSCTSSDHGRADKMPGDRSPVSARRRSTADVVQPLGSLADQSTGPLVKPAAPEPLMRLIDFNSQVLEGYLKKMVAMRQASVFYAPTTMEGARLSALTPTGALLAGSVFDEVQESIALPTEPARYLQDPTKVILSPVVRNQLRDFVSTIALLYQENHFHCFDHASHVLMSISKLLARVVTQETIDYRNMSYTVKAGSHDLHEYSYGITSDPLAQFALAYAALIHDVDHTGVPNSQLVKEGATIASMYKDRSPAEQHSIHLAWDLLMESRYQELRGCIYTNQEELDRFRALVINSVMATDICDKELKALRNARWDRAFEVGGEEESREAAMNRKATIVIEHLIQASDVSHTMQHWHVFLKWNKRLFLESYQAFLDGRADQDPLETWYQGEIGFFDFYVIPLAKKLKECGVFGVSSDEYLQYALCNRSEWELKGCDVVKEYRLEAERLRRRLDHQTSPHHKEP